MPRNFFNNEIIPLLSVINRKNNKKKVKKEENSLKFLRAQRRNLLAFRYIYFCEERRLKGCRMPSRPESSISWEQIVCWSRFSSRRKKKTFHKSKKIFKTSPQQRQHSQMCCHTGVVVICSIIISRIYIHYISVKCVLKFSTFFHLFLLSTPSCCFR